MHAKIIADMMHRQWMMLPSALRGIQNVVLGDTLTADDYQLFHKAEKAAKIKALDALGTPVENSYYSYVKNNVGILFVDGPIIPRATWFSNISGIVSLDTLTNEYHALENTPGVNHIIGVFDTPGGDVTGLADFTSVVKESKVASTAYVFGMAASAGYYIASGFDKRVSSEGGMVGSIGTVLMLRDTIAADEKKGIKSYEIVSSQSENKRPDPTTEEGMAVLQTMVNDHADVFINTLSRNLNVTREKILSDFGRGAMLVAGKALEAGMIDGIDTLENLISKVEVTPNSVFSTQIALQDSACDVTVEENNMDGKDKNVLTADEHKKQLASAVAQERERVAGIDALGAKFKGDHPKVVSAVEACLAKARLDPESNAGTTALELLDAVNEARTVATNDHGNGRRESADTAHNFTSASAASEQERKENFSQERVNGLVAAFDEMGGK